MKGFSKSINTSLLTIGLLFSFSGLCHAGSTSELTLLVSSSVHKTQVIQSIAQKFEEAYPEVKVTLKVDNSLSLFDKAKEGEGDILISHYPEGEGQFMDQGFGVLQARFMYNKFAILGPIDDPLNLRAKKH